MTFLNCGFCGSLHPNKERQNLRYTPKSDIFEGAITAAYAEPFIAFNTAKDAVHLIRQKMLYI